MSAERDALAALVAAWDSEAYNREWGQRMTAAIDAARVVLAAQPDNDQSGREGNKANGVAEQSTPQAWAPTQGEFAEYLAPDPTAAPAQDMWTRLFNHAVPPFAAPAQGEPQERMGTHWDGCSTEGGPRHYDCALRLIEQQAREMREMAGANALAAIAIDTERLRAERAEAVNRGTDARRIEAGIAVAQGCGGEGGQTNDGERAMTAPQREPTLKCVAGCGRPSMMPDSEYCAECAAETNATAPVPHSDAAPAPRGPGHYDCALRLIEQQAREIAELRLAVKDDAQWAQENERLTRERDEWKLKYGDANEWGLRHAAAWKERAERAEAERDALRDGLD